jgi:glycosyltransferase involved in cell wall biosynthesis
MLSFIIPAHNEERLVGAAIDSAHASARPTGRPYEVIVVNDASTDRTAAVAAEHGARVIDVGHRHIAATRNAGARAASGNVLFFLDADTRANPPAVRAALRALDRGAVGGGCVFRYDGPVPWWAHVLYPIGVGVGRATATVGGAFLFCRRADFEAVGGFDERFFAAEDLAFVRALQRSGRFVVPRPTVLTSNRKLDRLTLWGALAELFRVVVRGPEAYRKKEGLGLWYGPEARA